LYGDTAAVCIVTGTVGNGYVPGQINQLVDPLPWVQSVTNTTESEGGAGQEEDDPYRGRIRQAPEKYSVAGPDGAYRFWAMSANQNIVDVSVRSPSPGVVELRPLLTNGEIPGTEILDTVLEIVSNKKVRPLTDNVIALQPESVVYDIELVYYIDKDNITKTTAIQQAVAQAINEYNIWQKTMMGRSINPTELIWRIRAAGASRVEVVLPAYVPLEKYQVAQVDSVTASFGGISDG
jgi:phage-related baseplate assembly protein